jgi:hypothetical protein
MWLNDSKRFSSNDKVFLAHHSDPQHARELLAARRTKSRD